MGDEWYCRIRGAEQGPLTFPQLVDLVLSRRLTPHDELRYGTEGAWSRADSIEGLFPVDEQGFEAAGASGTEPEEARDLAEFPIDHETATDAAPSIDEFASVADPYAGDWYGKSMGLEFGPVPFAELLGMAARGVLSATNRLRQGKSGEWQRADSVPQIRHALETSARGSEPQPPAASTDAPAAAAPVVPPSEAAPPPEVPLVFKAPADRPESATGLPHRSMVAKAVLLVAVVTGLLVAVFLLRGPTEKEQYEQLSGLYAEMKSMRERRAPDAEWTRLAERIKRDVMPWANARSNPGDSASRKALTEAGRDHLLPMVGESRRKPGPHEREFLRCLDEARSSMGGG